ncbi:hypothetical protein FRB99_007534 [Tulasnella sp. 403]|nr:hypothetical protein FRB99_007534 [Tulasnella sp. 403]
MSMSEIFAPCPSPPSPQSYFCPPTPPPTTPSTRRPSLSAVAMNWLSHKSNSSISSLSALKTRSMHRDSGPTQQSLRISEPYFFRDDPTMAKAMGRQLGQGAEVVGTPQQALDRRSPSPPFQPKHELSPIPQSPEGLPNLLRSSKSTPQLKSPTRSARPPSPPVLPKRSSLRPIVPPLTPFPTPPARTMTPLPASETLSPLPIPPLAIPAPFEPVLVSPSSPTFLPKNINPRQFIITLETCTQSFRTTLATLTSHPSFLADFFETWQHRNESEDASSEPSSPFTRAFTDHLTSQGIHDAQSPTSRVHIFLDRPSAPYSHVLTYLRSSPDDPCLPRTVQFSELGASSGVSYDAGKVDALLELRDEASFLGMEQLVELCTTELKRWYAAKATGTRRRPTSGASYPVRSAKPSLEPIITREGSNLVASPAQERVPEVSSVILPWSDSGLHSSFHDDASVYPSSVGHGLYPAPPPSRPLPQAPMSLTIQPTVVAGLRIRNRSRSNSRTGETSARPMVIPPPSASPRQLPSRGSSFLPSMKSPGTPKTAGSSSGTWI